MIMNRSTLPKLLRLVAVATLSVFALTGATPKPVHPLTGTGGPILIAIVGDHYLDGDVEEFNQDVKNFITRGLLLDPYFKTHKDDWRFVSYFEPTEQGKQSRYGFKIGFGEGNCSILDNQDPNKTTLELLNDAVGGDTPLHTIVIGNHRYNFGCSKGDWTYVAVGAVGTDVLAHEFGHRIGHLWDEWAAPDAPPPTNGASATPHFPPSWRHNDTRNCWPVGTGAPTPPSWHSPPRVEPPVFMTPYADALGCDQKAAGVIHPYHHCRMGAAHVRAFCDVCKAEMDRSFKDLIDAAIAAGNYADATREDIMNLRPSHEPGGPRFRVMNAAFVLEQQPPPKVPGPAVAAESKPVLKVIMRYNPETRTATIQQMTDGTGRYIPNSRRSGQYMYEIMDGATLVDVGVIPEEKFEMHGSRNGAPHVTGKLKEAEIILMVPGRTVASLASRPLQVRFSRISGNVTERNITKANVEELRKGGGFEDWGSTALAPKTAAK
jgi:hypothetical protein